MDVRGALTLTGIQLINEGADIGLDYLDNIFKTGGEVFYKRAGFWGKVATGAALTGAAITSKRMREDVKTAMAIVGTGLLAKSIVTAIMELVGRPSPTAPKAALTIEVRPVPAPETKKEELYYR